MGSWLAIIGSLISGAMGAKAANDAAAKALEVGNANADDLLAASQTNADEIRRISRLNARAVLKTANRNAESIWKVGLANAEAEIQAGIENVGLLETEHLEVLRRHQIKTVELASTQRAATGASGVRVGQGSPLEVLRAGVDAGFVEQAYIANYGRLQLDKVGNEAKRRGELTWLSAKERGVVMVKTAVDQKALMLEEGRSRASGLMRDANLNASSLRRGGSLIAMNYRNQATTSLINGIMGGITAYNTI